MQPGLVEIKYEPFMADSPLLQPGTCHSPCCQGGLQWRGVDGVDALGACMPCMMMGAVYGAVGKDTQSTYPGLFIPQEATRW